MSTISLEPQKVMKAVQALRQIGEKLEKENKLLDEVESVEMQVCLKKIPSKMKTVKLRLPHSIMKEDMEVCLFVKDLDRDDRDYEPTVRHFQDLFRKKGVKAVTDIIPLKSVKTEYKPYESKRNLSLAYDVYLADARIVRLLPSYLGKHFYGKKKIPVQVNLQAKDLAQEINSAIGNSRCLISTKGSSSTSVVGHVQMSDTEIGENVIASATQISEGVPGGYDNIKMMNIKLKHSTSIPVFLSKGAPQDIKLPKRAEREEVEAEEITTVFGAKVKVYPSGYVKLVNEDGSDKYAAKRRKSSFGGGKTEDSKTSGKSKEIKKSRTKPGGTKRKTDKTTQKKSRAKKAKVMKKTGATKKTKVTKKTKAK